MSNPDVSNQDVHRSSSDQNLHYFGIRHHGPGSAKRLLAAFDALQPKQVLIEGPSDCSNLLPMLAERGMQPPVALLAYAAEEPVCSLYYPFAEFSPEYQACLWAIRNGANVAFIDLPVGVQLAQRLAQQASPVAEDEPEDEAAESSDENVPAPATFEQPAKNLSDTDRQLLQLHTDPIGVLAALAGYEDGEAWWNDLIEQNRDDDLAIFEQVAAAMQVLREQVDHLSQAQLSQDAPQASQADPDSRQLREQQRESYMRLEISKAVKGCEGVTAVVCGAWHVPALNPPKGKKANAKADREIIKTLPNKLAASKLKTTWIPWTSPRLATASGYGAGVPAPMWYLHLWRQRHNPEALHHWLAQVTRKLRKSGQIVSTASVIEAVRLSTSLAAVRGRPSPGFEEIRDAIIACLCFGEPLIWQQIEHDLLLGHQVGRIPDNAPLVPLLEDLQRQQKKLGLKPSALDRELALDLRSGAGAGKSILLHRLTMLGVHWGRLSDAGKSRGTFRERWILRWQPEFAVSLVENLVYGSTIEQAASNKISEQLTQENNLSRLAEHVQSCLEAQLDSAAANGLKQINQRAAHTSDTLELLESLPPLVNLNRYGTARDISLTHVAELINRLTLQAAVAIPYACRNLNDDEAQRYCTSIGDTHHAIALAKLDDYIVEDWWRALSDIASSDLASLQIAGLCARLLYLGKRIEASELQARLQRTLSPALPAADAARYFEGFFAGTVQRLVYDEMLLDTVEQWLLSLEEDSFVEFLPLFRRVFSSLDAMERKRLLDAVLGARQSLHNEKQINTALLDRWPNHLQRIGKLIQRTPAWKETATKEMAQE